MRIGKFEVILRAPSGLRFPEVVDSEGKCIAVATPGARFEVVLLVHHDGVHTGEFCRKSLTLDGISPGYQRIGRMPGADLFRYFYGESVSSAAHILSNCSYVFTYLTHLGNNRQRFF